MEPSSASRLVVSNLCKTYRGGKVANDDLSLQIGAGEVFGLLGPNGAGKTTLVKQIIGLLAPTSGGIQLQGHDLVADPVAARQLCSYLPQSTMPIDTLKVWEAIEVMGRIRGGARGEVRDRAQELIEALEIEEWNQEYGAKLSGGIRRLVGFVMAVAWPAPLIILDEPTNDIDPLRRRLLWRQIRRLGDEGSAVLLVTHNVLEAEQAVDRLAVIDGGRLIAQGTPSSLKAPNQGTLRLQLNLLGDRDGPEVPDFAVSHLALGRRLLVQIPEQAAPESIIWSRELMESGQIEEYTLGAATLEDEYIRLIGRDDALELAQASAPQHPQKETAE